LPVRQAGTQHRDREAAELLRRALEIFEHALEPSHPTLAACRNNHRDTLRRIGG
jgi:hypothetical protein